MNWLKNNLRSLTVIGLLLVAAFGFVKYSAYGAHVPTTQVNLSNHTINQPADHAYRFQTPSGIDSPTDTITIDLSDWVTGAVNFGDIDLFHGPSTGLETANTLAALPAAGIWGAAFSGGILTLAPPANSVLGTIPANDFITVRIGQNAVGGTNRLVNPGTSGSHSVTIAGGFGDIAYAAQAINQGNSVTVRGEVLPTLQITSLNPSSVIQGTCGINVTITGYGFVSSSVAQINSSARPTIYVSSTELIMTPLCSEMASPATLQVTVNNPLPGITSNELPFTVTTQSGPGCTEIPVISDIQVSNITSNSARITWNTNVAANSLVEYGPTTSYGQSVSNGSMVFSHGIDLTGLSASTTYHFRVISESICGFSETSPDQSFTTTLIPPLSISNVSCSNITDTGFNVIWDTNRAADSRVEYGQTLGLGAYNYLSGFVSNHVVPLTSLANNTTYYYQVISNDTGGLGATSTVYECKTLPDLTPPTNVNLTASPDCNFIDLAWNHSPEPDFAGVRVMCQTTAFPAGPFEGNLVYDGLALSAIYSGLASSTTYYCAAYAYDTNGNFASGALASTATVCPAPPIPPTPTTTTTTPPIPPTPTTTTTTPPLPPAASTSTTATTTPPAVPATVQIIPLYYGSNGTLALEPDPSDVRGVLSAESILVRVPVSALGETAVSGTVTLNGQIYSLQLTPDGTQFTGTFIAPVSGSFTAVVQVTLASGAVAAATDNFNVQNPGDVVEADIIKGITPIPGATVTLYQVINGAPVLWNGAPYGQPNPILSDSEGNFVFRVPNGEYFTEVGKVGFKLQRSPTLQVERNVFGEHIELIYIPEPVIISTCEIDCSKLKFDLYIVNPNGTKRLTNTEYVVTENLGDGLTLYRFEDKGSDFDYNDVLVQVDYTDCTHLKFNILKTNTGWHHAIHALIYYEGSLRRDYLLTSDSHDVYGQTLTLDLANDPALCEESQEVLQIDVIPAQIEFAMLTTVDLLRMPEIVSLTNDWVAPALLSVSFLNLGAALSLFNFLAYLQYLFTQPIMLFGRLRRRRWGVIYNSLNKQPIEMAVVRLLHYESRMIVQSKVTDKEGRYFFRAKQGNYLIEVVKPQFDFPTSYLANKNNDAIFSDLYHGETINVQDDTIIALNIPLDPVVPIETPRRIIYKRFFKHIQHFVAFSSILLALISFIISPSIFVGMVFLAQIGFYLLFCQLALPANAKSWGKVYDAKTKKPITNAIVRIFDKQFNKLLETQLTTPSGKYGFFAEHNKYYITVEKEGYQKYTSADLDLGSQKETVLDIDIPLKREIKGIN